MLLYEGEPVLAIIVEVQLHKDRRRATWMTLLSPTSPGIAGVPPAPASDAFRALGWRMTGG